MARVFTEGAEFGDTLFFSSGNGTASQTVVRTGSYSYLAGNNQTLVKTISPLTEFYFRTAFYINLGTQLRIVDWFNDETELGSIRRNAGTGRLEAYVGGTLVATGTLVTTNLTWYLLEVHVKFADASGDIEVKLDGIPALDIDFSGDTKPGAATNINVIKLNGGSGGGFLTYFDDIALNNINGSVDNSWCGEGKIARLYPNANGDVTQLIGSDGNQTDNYLLVDEFPYDSDTTYVTGSGIDNYDLYNVTTSGLVGATVSRLWPESRSRKIVAQAGKLAFRVKTNGVEYTQSGLDLTTTYAPVVGSGYIVNPQTGLPWTTSELDSLQIGFVVKD